MSHGERILHALRDGQWHTTAWLYRNGCEHMILHSRVSALRDKGHNIEGRHVPGRTGAEGYEYRLLPSVTYVDVPKVRRVVEEHPSLPPAEQLTIDGTAIPVSVGPDYYDL
jgi:hypothetical protein